jgi:phosphoribosylformylglycinamidine synthase
VIVKGKGGEGKMMRAKVYITLKSGVLDPQGETVKGALETLGFAGVQDVRIGKFMVITLNGVNREDASKSVETMCQKLLANPIIEDYRFEVEEG